MAYAHGYFHAHDYSYNNLTIENLYKNFHSVILD